MERKPILVNARKRAHTYHQYRILQNQEPDRYEDYPVKLVEALLGGHLQISQLPIVTLGARTQNDYFHVDARDLTAPVMKIAERAAIAFHIIASQLPSRSITFTLLNRAAWVVSSISFRGNWRDEEGNPIPNPNRHFSYGYPIPHFPFSVGTYVSDRTFISFLSTLLKDKQPHFRLVVPESDA